MTTNKLPLTDAQRTVVFSDKEVRAIVETFNNGEPEDVSKALEEIAQFILNTAPDT